MKRTLMTPAVSTPGALALRNYQQEAITAITAAWLRGIRRPLIALPTGSGKTIGSAIQVMLAGNRSFATH
jgi:superfamily II DNA or RNA helicase